MKKLVTITGSLILCALLAACHPLGKDNSIPPAPLTRITPTLPVHVAWTQHIGDGNAGYYLRLTPATSNGKIFAASHDGVIAAMNAQSGRTIWSTNIGKPVSSGLATGQNKVFVGTGNAQVVALSQTTGKVIWRRTVSSQVLAPVQYSHGIVLVHTIAGSLAGLSASDGRLVWRYDQSVPSLILHAAGQPQVAGNLVVSGFANGNLSVVNLYSGQTLWSRQIAIPMGDNPVSQMIDITVNPVVVSGVVYVATYQGRVAAIDLTSGQIIWQQKMSSFAGITADSQRVYVSDAKSRVWSYDEGSGAVDWKQTALLGRQITGPVVFGSALVVADRYGYLHFLSLTDGHFIARLGLGDGALAAPITYRGMLYVYTSNGDLVAVRA